VRRKRKRKNKLIKLIAKVVVINFLFFLFLFLSIQGNVLSSENIRHFAELIKKGMLEKGIFFFFVLVFDKDASFALSFTLFGIIPLDKATGGKLFSVMMAGRR
jgi:nucleoside permease NupC